MPRRKNWRTAEAKRGVKNPKKKTLTGDTGPINSTRIDLDMGDTDTLNNSNSNNMGDTDLHTNINNSNSNHMGDTDLHTNINNSNSNNMEDTDLHSNANNSKLKQLEKSQLNKLEISKLNMLEISESNELEISELDKLELSELNQNSNNNCAKELNQNSNNNCAKELNQNSNNNCARELNQNITKQCARELNQNSNNNCAKELNQNSNNNCARELNQNSNNNCAKELNQNSNNNCAKETCHIQTDFLSNESNNSYAKTDSHKCTLNNPLDSSGKSILIGFADLHDLLSYLYAFYSSLQIDLDSQYEILPVCISSKDTEKDVTKQIKNDDDQKLRNTKQTKKSYQYIKVPKFVYMKNYMQNRRKNKKFKEKELNVKRYSKKDQNYIIMKQIERSLREMILI
ncbi:unnamed protein product [Mytilus coruscus]|uniref:Uncharacterized protein n=1 Tax=Mytilus coruscus TaxID=42192 RepID=A0A6J8D127_MYTCO|nr:unnamed protein product [Mytilus coruscus]